MPVSDTTYDYPGTLDLIRCSQAEREAYFQGRHDGYMDGWRQGNLFAARSSELTEQTAAEIEAGVRRFREDHERRSQQTGGAR